MNLKMLKLPLICYYFLWIGTFYYPVVQSADDCGCMNTNDCADNVIGDIIKPRRNIECAAGEVCCFYPKDQNENDDGDENPVNNNAPKVDPDYKDECGYRYENRNGVGNYNQFRNGEAKLGEFPWMVSIIMNNKVQCGGSLISPSVVLTAAHCIDRKPTNSFKIRAGDWDLSKTNEPFKHQQRNIKDFVIHPDYRKLDLSNDIALILLNKPYVFNSFINSICLPALNENFDMYKCISSGWGKYDLNSSYANILKRVDDLSIIPHAECDDMLKTNTKLPTSFNLHESFTCAGGEEGKDMCKGDGGSPLMCPSQKRQGQYIQAGIVSWGVGCNRKNVPGVYVNVAKFTQWINGKMTEMGFEHEKYYYLADINEPANDYDEDED